MREIKFEYGFESIKGIIKKVYSLHQIPNIKERCDVWNELPIRYVRQFTGLKDKNGKEIFEGDIVDIIHPCWTNKAITEFKNGSFIFRSIAFDTQNVVIPGYTFMKEKWEIEIIGNIYENPELLN